MVSGWLNLGIWKNYRYRRPTADYTQINSRIIQGSTVLTMFEEIKDKFEYIHGKENYKEQKIRF